MKGTGKGSCLNERGTDQGRIIFFQDKEWSLFLKENEPIERDSLLKVKQVDIIKKEKFQSRQEGRGSKVQGKELALDVSRNRMKRHKND